MRLKTYLIITQIIMQIMNDNVIKNNIFNCSWVIRFFFNIISYVIEIIQNALYLYSVVLEITSCFPYNKIFHSFYMTYDRADNILPWKWVRIQCFLVFFSKLFQSNNCIIYTLSRYIFRFQSLFIFLYDFLILHFIQELIYWKKENNR